MLYTMSSVDVGWLFLWMFSYLAEGLNEWVIEHMIDGIIIIAIILDLYLLQKYLQTAEYKNPDPS